MALPNKKEQLDAEELRYRKIVRGYISVYSDKLLEHLRNIVSGNCPVGLETLVFEVESDQFYDSFPIYSYSLDEDGERIDCIEPFDGKVLPEIDGVLPEQHGEVDNTYSERNVDTWYVASAELIEIFSECWFEAGGSNFKKAARVQHHDSIHYFDLKTKQWCSEE